MSHGAAGRGTEDRGGFSDAGTAPDDVERFKGQRRGGTEPSPGLLPGKVEGFRRHAQLVAFARGAIVALRLLGELPARTAVFPVGIDFRPHDEAIRTLVAAIRQLMEPPPPAPVSFRARASRNLLGQDMVSPF